MIILEYNVIASYGQTVNSTNHSCVYELLTYQLIEILKFSQRHSAHAVNNAQFEYFQASPQEPIFNLDFLLF